MSDILIRGMEMPRNCLYCAFVGYDNDHCTLMNKDIPIYATRPSWCPLVPLPEGHGRLIDRDKLLTEVYELKVRGNYRYVVDRADLLIAPTIIPADKEANADG